MPTVYLGFDERERRAYDVARSSILRRASQPVEIVPLGLDCPLLTRPVETRDGKLWCPISEAPMSTGFAIARFAVPFLCHHKGWAIFVDCDVVFLADVCDLYALADPRFSVQVVKHDYQPTEATKMDGCQNQPYPRKGQSSVMLINCSHPANQRLTLEVLNTWPGRDLHAFKWLEDSEIGELPPEWNHLVGVNPPNPNAKLLHYTLGTPDMPGYENCEYADEWNQEAALCK